ncbi:MAG: type III pantothenate kinase [Oscillospiraceae bacterium]|nr:type III pantothenate kinase [Oscillospiraceae bacterium]
MVLAVDIGNSVITVGCLDSEKIFFKERISTDLSKTSFEYAVKIKMIFELHRYNSEKLEGSIISSVVPPMTSVISQAVEKLLGVRPAVVGPGVKTGLNIMTDNPSQVGSDLVVSAVAAINLYGAPAIVINMGTATTFSVIDTKRTYIGGIIIPGINVSLNALVDSTSQLPRIPVEKPVRTIGKNTIECMKSGIVYGSAACIDGMIDRIEEETGTACTSVITGDAACGVVEQCRHKMVYDKDLILKGLMIIYMKNRETRL